jgi:hypothetical protein
MRTCKTSLILIIYTKPYETARTYAEAKETCNHVSVEERLGRVLCELHNPGKDVITKLINRSLGWSGEVRLKCPAKECAMLDCDQHGNCVINGRIVQVTRSKRGCTIRVGVKTDKPPEPPIPATVFYTSSMDELLDRMKYLEQAKASLSRSS